MDIVKVDSLLVRKISKLHFSIGVEKFFQELTPINLGSTTWNAELKLSESEDPWARDPRDGNPRLRTTAYWLRSPDHKAFKY